MIYKFLNARRNDANAALRHNNTALLWEKKLANAECSILCYETLQAGQIRGQFLKFSIYLHLNLTPVVY